MRITPEKRKELIESLTAKYRDSFGRNFTWGKPDTEYLATFGEVFALCLLQADEWIALAKQNGWKTVQAEAENLRKVVEDSLQFADRGGDPMFQGQWIIELLRRVPGEIVKQKLGITSLKEFRKVG